jgi:hypothetical protein
MNMKEEGGSGRRCASPARSTRRDVLGLASFAGLELAAGGGVRCALAQAADERPKHGDLLVAVDGTETRPLRPADVPMTPLLAWPMDPKEMWCVTARGSTRCCW